MTNLHTIYLFGQQAICPTCSGIIAKTASAEQFRCIDCHERYEVVERGRRDNEMICRSIEKVSV